TCSAPQASSAGTRRPPAETTMARWPAATRAAAISRVERSTPPDSSAGSSWTTVRRRIDDGAGARRGSVDQLVDGRAVRALGVAVRIVLDRQVHARMRVPQRHFRRRAAQRQVRAVHGVALLGIGGRGGGGVQGVGSGLCGKPGGSTRVMRRGAGAAAGGGGGAPT